MDKSVTVISWNVAGLNAEGLKSLVDILAPCDWDFIGLQEITSSSLNASISFQGHTLVLSKQFHGRRRSGIL
eukprot:6143100-Karenia_brevis.AAC.1